MIGAILTSALGTGVDLSGASLAGANLSKANLSKAKLSFSDLSRANLSSADLTGADLSGARLTGANLTDADLHGAVLYRAVLNNAVLSNTKLGKANLRRANLSEANVSHAKLGGANLTFADLSSALLDEADLSGADLSDAKLRRTNLRKANLTSAILARANVRGALLSDVDLSGAHLNDADLKNANLSGANLSGADCTGCMVFGISAWNLNLDGAIQKNLVISDYDEPVITVDNLEVAQFIYLLVNNKKIRSVIDTVTAKAVLILGRFADPLRKAVVDGLREKLRNFDLLPIVFDFDRPTDKDYTETIQTLAGMSMFVIADITDPKSTPLELEATVKQFKIPYIPIIDTSVDPRPFAMLVDLQKSFHWVLPTVGYRSKEELLDDQNLEAFIIDPARRKREELRKAKNDGPEMISLPRRIVNPGPPA
jgi:uncharacterized protein YjbI with pentapeptide repeats